MSRILVAEDDPEMRRLIVDALRGDGHEVAEAIDGGDVLRRLREARAASAEIDVLVSDMRMPGGNGLEILERLAAAGCRVSSILMTAFGDEAVRRRAKRAGAIYLEKPLSLDELRATVTLVAQR
jgi:two-component system phosphate regulon response regulator PhoB